jgi:hypothetical protein
MIQKMWWLHCFAIIFVLSYKKQKRLLQKKISVAF